MKELKMTIQDDAKRRLERHAEGLRLHDRLSKIEPGVDDAAKVTNAINEALEFHWEPECKKGAVLFSQCKRTVCTGTGTQQHKITKEYYCLSCAIQINRANEQYGEPRSFEKLKEFKRHENHS